MASIAQGRSQLLFVDCDGPTGRTREQWKRQKNRHAQRGGVSFDGSQAHSDTRMPMQITLKLAKPLTGRRNVLPKPPGDARKKVSGRCGECGKALKSSRHLAGLCLECMRGGGGAANSTADAAAKPNAAHDTRTVDAPALDFEGQVECSTLRRCPSRAGTLKPGDQMSLSYFQNFASFDLSGYQPGRFWDRLVLQVGESEPVVQQALVAVGSAHLDYCTTSSASTKTLVAYQAALQRLREYMESNAKPLREVAMICCILFFTFDRIMQDSQTARIHLTSGISILLSTQKLLFDRDAAVKPALGITADTLDELSGMLVKLDVELTMQSDDYTPQLDLETDLSDSAFLARKWSTPARFQNPHDAWDSWVYIFHGLWKFITAASPYRYVAMDELPSSIVTEWRSLQARIKGWRKATKGYIQTHPVILDYNKHGTVHARHTTRDMMDALIALTAEACYFSSKHIVAESLSDPHNPRPFDKNPRKLLDSAKTVIALRRLHNRRLNLQGQKTFSTHVGVLDALLLLARRTSSEEVSNEALDLVRQLARVGTSGLATFAEGCGAPPESATTQGMLSETESVREEGWVDVSAVQLHPIDVKKPVKFSCRVTHTND